jgi:hypothetical protein
MTLKFECPHCSQHISAEAEQTGETGQCPACKRPITVPTGLPATPPLLPFIPQERRAPLPSPAPPPVPEGKAKNAFEGRGSAITPKSILFCILMVIPAVLGGKISATLALPFLRSFYESATGSATISGQEEQILQFISCGIAGFVFVWIGILTTLRSIKLSRWVFLGLAVTGAIALVDLNGLGGMAGQIIGAVFATYVFYDGV